MKCRYCQVVLAPLRSLTDGEFCCDEHRAAFATQGPPPPPEPEPVAPMAERLLPLAFLADPAGFAEPQPLWFEEGLPLESSAQLPQADWNAFLMETPLELPEEEPQIASESEPEAASPVPPDPISLYRLEEVQELTRIGRWIAVCQDAPGNLKAAWLHAPRELKAITLLLPVLLALAVSPAVPKVRMPHSTGKLQTALSKQLRNLNQNVSNRAGVAFTDDFRTGLDAWQGRASLTKSWSYDAAGFVQPGPLAIFKPTTDLTDYRFEFLGEIDRKAIGCVFRAQDLDNYYAVKLVMVKPGPVPTVHVVRYMVINGKETGRVEKPVPFVAHDDTLYRIAITVQGHDFTVTAQDQIVDFWSDQRLPKGGVGFFCDRGERARLRWVQVSHQYDALGRLCSYLAPVGIDGAK